MVTVKWLGGMAFEATPPSGNKLVMDSHPDSGGHDRGPTPVETLLSSLAGCTAMDILSILEKKRQTVKTYRVEIEGDRPVVEGEWPRPFTAIRLRHIFSGLDLDPVAVARAIALSETKYCTVLATLRLGPPVTSTFEIQGLEDLVGAEKVENVGDQRY